MSSYTIALIILTAIIAIGLLYTTTFVLLFVVFYKKPLDVLDEYTQNPMHAPGANAKSKVDYYRYLSCYQYGMGFIWPKACKSFMKFSEHDDLTNAPVARWVRNMFVLFYIIVPLDGLLLLVIYILIQMDGS